MEYELFCKFALPEYFTPPPLMCKYIAEIIFLQLILSLLFVLSLAKLIETN